MHCQVWGPHSGFTEVLSLLGYCALSLRKCFRRLAKTVLSSYAWHYDVLTLRELFTQGHTVISKKILNFTSHSFLRCPVQDNHRLVNETKLVHDLFLLPGMQEHMLLHTRQSAIQNNKYQVSHKYSCSSWWWTWRGPKHLEVINKIDEILTYLLHGAESFLRS